MYHHLRGTLLEVNALDVVIEAGGIGWHVQVPLSTSEALRGEVDREVLLFTHLVVREDDFRLFGFATRAERRVFRMLLTASGAGPATALQALSSFSVDDLVSSLSVGDTQALQRIKGVGKRIAERLVLELREKAALLAHELDGSGRTGPPGRARGRKEGYRERALADATKALVALGWSPKDANRRALEAWNFLAAESSRQTDPPGGAEPEPGVASLIREALRRP